MVLHLVVAEKAENRFMIFFYHGINFNLIAFFQMKQCSIARFCVNYLFLSLSLLLTSAPCKLANSMSCSS